MQSTGGRAYISNNIQTINEVLNMKDKVLKVINVILEVILIISTLPFIGILLWAIYSSIFGSGFMGTEIYGWKAFALAIIAAFSSLSSILIVCLAYLIFYFGIVKKK